VLAAVQPAASDEDIVLTPQQIERLTELRGALRRNIEERTGARLSLLDTALVCVCRSVCVYVCKHVCIYSPSPPPPQTHTQTHTQVVYGKVKQREAARAALEEEFAKEEESKALACGFPLLLMRLIIGVGGANVRKLEEAHILKSAPCSGVLKEASVHKASSQATDF
jgi:hypothetical protein